MGGCNVRRGRRRYPAFARPANIRYPPAVVIPARDVTIDRQTGKKAASR
jgi:hypothetical protein